MQTFKTDLKNNLKTNGESKAKQRVHTVAGPMIMTFFSSAFAFRILVLASGIPSAIMAIVRIYRDDNSKHSNDRSPTT